MENKKEQNHIFDILPEKVVIRAKARPSAGVKLRNHLTLNSDIEKIEEIVREGIAAILDDRPAEKWCDFKLTDKQKKAIREQVEKATKGYEKSEARKLKSRCSVLLKEWQEYIQNAGALKHLEGKFTELKESIKLNKSGQSPEEKTN